ncbi:MAG: alpha/beta fold hydrolase [Devosia sp.]
MNATDPDRPVLFIQGGGADVHGQWDNKLVASLAQALGPGYRLHYPQMPNEDDPDFAAWSDAIAAAIDRLGAGSALVGHSVGGTVLVHTLASHPKLLQGIAALCLIAPPFVGPGGWPSDDIEVAANWAAPLSDTVVFLYRGDADETTPARHLELHARAMPHAVIRRLVGRDHQLDDDLREVAGDIIDRFA